MGPSLAWGLCPLYPCTPCAPCTPCPPCTVCTPFTPVPGIYTLVHNPCPPPPLPQVIGRAGSALNLVYEKTTESSVIKAVDATSDKLLGSRTSIQ